MLTRVSMDNNNLTGSIPSELFQFPLLTNFNMVSTAQTANLGVLGAPHGGACVHCEALLNTSRVHMAKGLLLTPADRAASQQHQRHVAKHGRDASDASAALGPQPPHRHPAKRLVHLLPSPVLQHRVQQPDWALAGLPTTVLVAAVKCAPSHSSSSGSSAAATAEHVGFLSPPTRQARLAQGQTQRQTQSAVASGWKQHVL